MLSVKDSENQFNYNIWSGGQYLHNTNGAATGTGQSIIVSNNWSSLGDYSFKISRLSDTQYWTDFRVESSNTSFTFSCHIYGSCTILFGVFNTNGQYFNSITGNTGKITGTYRYPYTDGTITSLVLRVIVEYNNPVYVDNLQLITP